MKPGLSLVTGTIAAGTSLSTAIDCSGGDVVLVLMPNQWDYAGGLTFQISPDDINFYDLLSYQGHEVHVPYGTPSAAIVVPREAFYCASSIKLRSGTAHDPVNQQADRQFSIGLFT